MVDSSIILINNNYKCNSFIRSNNNTIKFYYHLLAKAKKEKNEKLFEQAYIKDQLQYFPQVSLKELSLDVFPSGCEYVINKCNLFYDEIESINYNK